MSTGLADITANADSQHYWDCARAGRLVFRRCTACGHVQFPPRSLCPVCWSDRLEWAEHSGDGLIYSFTVVHRAPTPEFETPYVLAMIDLAGGIRMMANIVGPDALDAAIGDRVHVVFEPRGDATIPQFRRGKPEPGRPNA